MAPARRTRKKQRVQTDSDLSSEDEDFKPKAAKQVRRVRGKRGGLAKLPTMPLDVIFEILVHLHPSDLLNLARTSKDFRSILMRRNTSHMWKAAREGTEGLPPCPDVMSEPAYANLLFRSFCHNCGKGPCEKIYWECRARYCNSCKNRVSTFGGHDWPSTDLYTAFGDNIPFPLNLIPAYTLVPVVSERVVRVRMEVHSKDGALHTPDFLLIKNELSEMEDEQEIYAFVKAKAEQTLTLRQQLAKLANWKDRDEWIRTKSNEQIKKERIMGIKEKLTELGYQEEFEVASRYKWAFDSDPLVAQCKALTDRIWNNIEPKLVEKLEGIRHQHRKVKLRNAVRQRLHILDQALLAIEPRRQNEPSLRDIALMPEVAEIMVLETNKTYTVADFDFLRDTLPVYTEQWKKDVKSYLSGLVRAKFKLPASADPLSLAVGSVFICKLCNESCAWPNVITHTCWSRETMRPSHRDSYTDLVAEFLAGISVWQPSEFHINMDALKQIIEKLGLNPKKATMKQMDESPVRLTCTEHAKESLLDIKNWRAFHEHCVQSPSCHAGNWKVVEAAQLEAAKPLEAAAVKHEGQSANWRCAHCVVIQSSLRTKAGTLEHVRIVHKIGEPTEKDVVCGTTRPNFGGISVRLIDKKLEGKWIGDRHKSATAAYYPLS